MRKAQKKKKLSGQMNGRQMCKTGKKEQKEGDGLR
jgi:hypothetical protein